MPGAIKTSLLEAAALIGLGIIIENPEKRRTVINALDKAAATIEKTIKDFIPKGGAANANTSAVSELFEIE